MSENIADVNKKHWAYLYDRIQYFQGEPQRFGTQLNADGSIYPVTDRNQLNSFRQEYGLPVITHEELERMAKVEDIQRIESENPEYLMWRNISFHL